MTPRRLTFRRLTLRRDPGPMDCAAVAEVVQRFVDGELDEVRGARVDEHLAHCTWCADDAAELVRLKAALARGTDAPPGAAERLRALGEELLRRR